MISLDQVLLLQEKVETAVQRLAQLNADNERLTSENDALRSKCAELSKALEDKTELVSNLESDQNKIEAGILSALSRLDTVENSVLSAGSSTTSNAPSTNENTSTTSQENPSTESASSETQETTTEQNADIQPASSIDGQFDIF
ncbi:MAG TPA: hypothetical protein DC014_02470 [Treponema sp.]|nr:hypothetical protein [Treponema sp.]